MGEVRACVFICVIFLCFQISIAKPFFGTGFWCEMLCDDEDTSPVDPDDFYDVWCDDCPTRPPRPTTTAMPPAAPMNGIPPPFPGPFPGQFPGPFPGAPLNFMIPNGVNISMVPDPNRGGWWNFGFQQWTPPPGGAAAPPAVATPAPAPAATTAAGTTAAGATPAPAPAATTAAGTTAAGATTVAATTAAAAGK